MKKKKYRSVYFKNEALWDVVDWMASNEQRSVNAMIEILVKKAIGPNKILDGLEKAGVKTTQSK